MRLPLSVLALSLCLPATAQAPYVRFPAPKGDQVYFTSEGDLWRASQAGGRAVRLTTHAGQETRPSASPDGKWLAFTGTYEGPAEVYVMPVEGGQPRRLTFEGQGCAVLGWTTKGEVLFTTVSNVGPARRMVIATVHPSTLARTTLPLADASEACMDEGGRYLFFTRMGLHLTNDNARNYRGGAAAEIWRFDLQRRDEAVKLAFDAPMKRPMVWKDRLVVVSDKDGCDNLWSLNFNGGEARQLTHHKEWDVRGASLADGRVAYQSGSGLRIFDLATNQDRAVALNLISDFDQRRERLVRKPLDYLDNVALSANGERVALTARGQVALVALQSLRRVEVPLPEGSRAREATLSPDGKWIYLFCDATGESQLWRFPAEGGPEGKALTSDKGVARVNLFPSPDGSLVAHTDRQGRLWLLNPATSENRLVDTNEHGGSPDLRWAPDGKSLLIQRSASGRQMRQLVLCRVADGQKLVLTSDKYDSHSPAFSPDGRWLWFLSERAFQVGNGAPWGDRNMGPFFERRTKLYGLALQEDDRFPFLPKTELDGEEKDGKEGRDGKSEKGETKPAIQWQGLAERLYEVPLAAGNYQELRTDGKRLYFLDREGRTSSLKTLEIGNSGAQAEVFATDLQGFDLSANGKKVLLVKRGASGQAFYLVEAGAKAPGDLSKAEVKTGDWAFPVDPKLEWKQMFQDAWRMHRDWFFDHAMRGVDWEAVRRKYEPLVAQVSDRSELNDLLGQMVGELGALHSQTRPGEQRIAEDG
ncbi:MAG: peptidase S41, partial [Firmicutes bacterium]|nr:peptidase S41 [Bacillota bacterium]